MAAMESSPRAGRAAWLAALAAAALDASCAAVPEAPAAGGRLIVTTHEAFATLEAASQSLARAAGSALRDIRPLSPRQFALTLDCAEPTICDRARERLAADRETVAAVEADGRQRVPARPAPGATR